jgi:hypothetical protein
MKPSNCANCKWWSETCAQSIGCELMEALCENKESKNFSQMTAETASCEHHDEIKNEH